VREQLEAWVDAHKDEIIAETQAILRIPSVEEEATAGPGAPFGAPIAEALEHTLALCARLGMNVENFDGYAGHAELGEGGEIVGMLGHLDVVPPGGDWTVDPWGAEIRDGWLWARGSSDDKGPTYAALFGAKAVLDVTRAAGVRLRRRMRLIFGCDEESGWDCMEHYFGKAGQPKPDLAFTPDAYFPLVYAEKGSFTAVATRTVESGAIEVSEFRSGLRPNMVPGEAEARLRLGAGDSAVEAALRGMTEVSAQRSGDSLIVSARGRSAHASTPYEGDNAAVKLLRALVTLPALPDKDWMNDLIQRASPDGAGVDIAGEDTSGPLTCNLGVVTKENGQVQAVFNVRYPATWDGDETKARFAAALAAGGWRVEFQSHLAPLYVPQDAEPVKTLLRVYREHTGDDREPMTMGGRTYATAVAPRGVAFGAALPGDPEVAHQADERFPVERLLQCAKIYAHALYELAMLP
jgi:succinyl-diaminopimelate desuccinylase